MAGTSSRGNPSMGDVVRSVLVLGAGVLAIWFAAQIFTVSPDRPVEGENLEQVVAAARPAVTGFDLLAPTELPEGWIVTSARPEPDAWALNVLTDDDRYVGLQQARASVEDLFEQREKNYESTGTTRIDGREWTTWEGGRDVAYTRTDGDVSTLVVGEAPPEQVEAYVASLGDGS